MVIREYFPFIVPFLLVALCVCFFSSWADIKNKTWHLIFVFIVSACLTFIPFFDFSLAAYILSVNPNFSIGSLALITIIIIPYFLDQPILKEKYLISFCLWNLTLSLGLFSCYLGFVPYDLYALGYGLSPWFVVMAIITLLLVWAGNPLSLIFLAAIAAFHLKLLPSGNFFDYLTDGFLLILSVGVLVCFAVKNRRSRPRPEKIATKNYP